MNLKSFLIGLSLGLSGKPLPISGGEPSVEPVAYLYNGVRLPKLPEWDKEMYPYAAIDYHESPYYGETYHLEFYTLRPYWKEDGVYPPAYCASGVSGLVDGKWADIVYVHFYPTAKSTPFWTSFDVLNEDGSIYMAASEPIPVYE